MKYRMDLAYLGHNFQGWQTQPEANAIQDHLQKALTIFLRQPTLVTGAARTDSGVHAEHQVCSFETDVDFDTLRLLKGINALLPSGISPISVYSVDQKFHPIRSAKAKLYRYRIWTDPLVSPFCSGFVWHVRDLPRDPLLTALSQCIGRHDFSSFCATDSSAKTFDREIFDIKVLTKKKWLEVYIFGEGFLKQMVRNIVGTGVDLCFGRLADRSVRDILAKRNRQAAGLTAPSSGLSLVRIYYDDVPAAISLGSGSEEFGFSIV